MGIRRSMDWLYLAQDSVQWWILVNLMMTLHVSKEQGIF
jgi:hypothetical protein